MIKKLHHSFSHSAAPIIGFTRNIQPTGKQNHSGFVLGGMWMLRLCDCCEEVFSADGCVDMLGMNKHAVRVGPSVLFVDACRNGCPPEDLYVTIQDANQNMSTPPMTMVGCNFCSRKVTRAKVGSALLAWEKEQNPIAK